MSGLKRVRAKEMGYMFERLIQKGEEFEVPSNMTAKWWEELDAPAKRGRKPAEESPAVE